MSPICWSVIPRVLSFSSSGTTEPKTMRLKPSITVMIMQSTMTAGCDRVSAPCKVLGEAGRGMSFSRRSAPCRRGGMRTGWGPDVTRGTALSHKAGQQGDEHHLRFLTFSARRSPSARGADMDLHEVGALLDPKPLPLEMGFERL